MAAQLKQTRRCSSHLGVALVVCILLATAQPTSVPAKVQLEVEVGFGQGFTAGAWAPLRVRMENFPDPEHPEEQLKDLTGEVQVTVMGLEGSRTRYSRRVELPQHARKMIELPIMLPASNDALIVEMIDQSGGLIARKDLTPGARRTPGTPLGRDVVDRPLVLLAADENEVLTFPMWVARSASIVQIPLERLAYDFKSYDAVRLVVVRQKLTNRLTTEQLDALEDWIGLGGQLVVIVSRASAEMKLDPWLGGLLPGRIDTTLDVRLSDIEPGAGDELTLLTRWEELYPSARVLWDSPIGPVAVERRRGAGRVVALGLDPSSLSSAGLGSSLGRRLQMFLESVLFAPRREDLRARHYWSTANIDPDFSSVLILPNIWIVSGLLAIFVVVVGPINFFILRRKRRLELAWITIPGLSIFFFFTIYAYGLWAKGGDQYHASAEILHLSAGESQGLLLWNSIQFSPKRSVYEFKTAEGGVVLPLMRYYDNPSDFKLQRSMHNLRSASPFRSGATKGRGEPAVAVARGADGYDLFSPVDQWKMAFYQGERPIEIEGSISGRVIYRDSGFFGVEVENNTETELAEVTLYFGENRRYELGNLAPGQRLRRDYAQNERMVSSSEPSPITENDGAFHTSSSYMIQEGATTTYPLLPNQRPQRRARLVARQVEWSSGVKIEPVPEVSKFCALVEVDLPIQLEGKIRLSTTDSLRREVYDYERKTQFSLNSSQFCSLRDSWVDVLIAPARVEGPLHFVNGRLTINFTIQNEDLVILVFDYSRGEWDQAWTSPPPVRTQNRAVQQLLIKKQWVNPMGSIVRVRLLSSPRAQNANRKKWRRQAGVIIGRFEASMTFESEPESWRSATAGEQSSMALGGRNLK